MSMTKRDQMLECIEEIENRQTRLEGHDIWQDQLVWWMAKAICLLLREAAIAERDEVRAPSKPVVEPTGRADAQRSAGRWIPVSERLPEVGRNVLLSVGKGLYTAEGNLKDDGTWVQYRWSASLDNVDAWAEMPEPWEGKEE